MYVGRCHAQVPSDHADNLQLALKCIPTKGFHHIFVGASLDRCLDMTKSVFRGAVADLGPCVTSALDQCLKKFHSAHHGHEICRASCRDRVCQYVSISVYADYIKKQNN